MSEKAPERHLDKERNKILNVAVTKLDRIINEHDPEVDAPIKDGVWDHLDNVCASLEARVAAERDALAAEVERLRGHLEDAASAVEWGARRMETQSYKVLMEKWASEYRAALEEGKDG